ncbi:MAG: hypothetical protein ACYDC5_01625 [Candidatus Dormibacteria bacterium]
MTRMVSSSLRPHAAAGGRAVLLRVLIPALLALVLSSCGQELPAVGTITRHTATAMAHSSYRISGTAKAGLTTTTFSVVTFPDGNFSGRVVTIVPGSPSLSLQVVAYGSSVYVLSPLGLAQLGITSLPGNLNPDTTWIVQTPTTASRYRQSLAPFTGPGLETTLKTYLKAPLSGGNSSWHGVPDWLVEEGSASSSLRLYIAKGSYHLLQLTVTGRASISLKYDLFGRVAVVTPPPAAQVYSPPAAAPGS